MRLIHTFVTYELSTQQAISFFFKNHFHGHDFPVGVVTCMASIGDRITVSTSSPAFLALVSFTPVVAADHAKDLDDRASLGAGIMAVSTTDVVRSDSSLFVSRARQRNQSILPCDKVLHLHRITHSIDV